MIFATTQTTPQQTGFGLGDLLLPAMLVLLIVFMFWSSRRRTKRMKDEQEAKALQMVPGVKVLLQGGLYGTLTHFDPEDLSQPARVELAPGLEIEVHSQALLRVVAPEEDAPADDTDADVPLDDRIEPRAVTEDVAPDTDDKPQA